MVIGARVRVPGLVLAIIVGSVTCTVGGAGQDAMFSAGDAYERFMGRWSRQLAPSFVTFAGVRDGDRVLDVGSGTGPCRPRSRLPCRPAGSWASIHRLGT